MLYVSNLSKRIRDSELKEAFSKCGNVINTNIIRDPFTDDCRGFGFIFMETEKQALEAIEVLHKTELDHRIINVELSKRSRPHESTPGVYLGPTATKKNNYQRYSGRGSSKYSPERRYKTRSRSRSRSLSYKERSYKRRK